MGPEFQIKDFRAGSREGCAALLSLLLMNITKVHEQLKLLKLTLVYFHSRAEVEKKKLNDSRGFKICSEVQRHDIYTLLYIK